MLCRSQSANLRQKQTSCWFSDATFEQCHQASSTRMSKASRGGLEVRDRARPRQVAGDQLRGRDAIGAVEHRHRAHRRAPWTPSLRSWLEHTVQHVERELERGPLVAAASRVCSESWLGQGAACTVLSCHHDHASSPAKTGGTAPATASARRGCPATRHVAEPASGIVSVGELLHELEVVVAETPEEALGHFERACVSRSQERLGGFSARPLRSARASHDRRDGSRSRERSGATARNWRRFNSLSASRRPTASALRTSAVSVTGSSDADQLTDSVGAVALEQRHRRHHVALRLRHLLAVGIEHHNRCINGSRSTGADRARIRTHDAAEQPRTD